MLLLQFSTSHYCRKARLALGYKQIAYQVENLTPGIHALKLRPLTGLTTLPVLLPQQDQAPNAIGDSTHIFHFLETSYPEPPLTYTDPELNRQLWLLEDWLDESIGTATRFVYYDYRSKEGRVLDPSWSSQLVIQTVRWQYGIRTSAVELAADRLRLALEVLGQRWDEGPFLVGDRPTYADLAAAALLSPLARIPAYRQEYPAIFERITAMHHLCHEPLPPGL